ncbi:hypothetical protein CPB83DRAFT_54901 [Crepidotus variabilis]|uniref:Uncharacterized protein n=1 Tax=Crepidotus variabilis TaxID=179855 RepID=A0A9P6JT75_9AGAR|nr:hypothetical protein CPB83DRAFT_54901 [Crepidotus variabilis]
MPSFTTVVEDCSPLIVYSPQWRRGTSRDDKLDSYSQSSFMASTKASDSLTFQYQGTSVTVVGAKRDNHGRYHVTVDSAPSYSASGISQDNSFNQTLFTAQLEYGVHNLVLTNDEDKYLDIDYIAFDTTIGDPEEPLIINSYQDIHPAFTYSPSSSWNQADQASWFSGSSGHQSSDSSAVAQLVFKGVAVALYGSVGPRSSDHFGVKVDDQPLRTLSAKKDQFRAQQLLFWAGDLTPGNHTLFIQQLTNRGAVAIDYANAYTTQSLGGSYDNFVKQLTSGNSTFSR